MRNIIAQRLDSSLNSQEQFELPLKADDKQAMNTAINASAFLFPIRVLVADNQSAYMKLRLAPRWQHHLVYALFGCLLALVIMAFRWKKQKTSLNAEDVVFVSLFGLLGLLVMELITHHQYIWNCHQ